MPEKTMTDADPGEEATLFPKTAGERLREARESQGLTLAEVAARTRVPVRHLEAIEKSNYSGLPSPTYSVGFAKAYARAIGMDEVTIGRDVRGQTDKTQRPPEYQPYEMQDLKRLPPPGLAMASVVVALLVLIGVGLWYGTTLFRGDGEPVASTAPTESLAPIPVPTPTAAPAPVTTGQVTLIATDVVWLRLYDADGKTLYEAEMKPGDRYDVPGDANQPMINVGRPDKLQVLVNGSAVPPLGDGARAIKDVGVSAAALLARGQPGAEPSPVATSAPGALPDASSNPAPRSVVRRAAPLIKQSPTPSRSVSPSAGGVTDPPAANATPTAVPTTAPAAPPTGEAN